MVGPDSTALSATGGDMRGISLVHQPGGRLFQPVGQEEPSDPRVRQQGTMNLDDVEAGP
jgi:hypothetical protein